jgi:hypothetical protein
MLRTFELPTFQHWTLLGLKPMQRALIRRVVEAKAIDARAMRSLRWTIIEPSASVALNEDWSQDCLGNRPGVVIIDREYWIHRISDTSHESDIAESWINRSNSQIRLLWSWSAQGNLDLLWCTELCCDGVIFDIKTLHRWTRVCLDRAGVSANNQDSLLSGIVLPPV